MTTTQKIIDALKERGLPEIGDGASIVIGPIVAQAIAAAVLAEREACAKECFSAQIHKASYNLSGDTGRGYNFAMRDIAAAIRARKDVTK